MTLNETTESATGAASHTTPAARPAIVGGAVRKEDSLRHERTVEGMTVELDSLLMSWREQGRISETTFRKIAYENAEKLLGL